jgi:flagellar FliL protein
MAENEKKQGREEPAAPPKPSLRERLPKILMGVLLAVNFMAMIGGTFAIYTLKIAYKRPTINEESESKSLFQDRDIRAEKPVLYSFEPFTVNLDGRPRKLVRAVIQLEMLSEEGYEEVVNQTPVARDEIVRILNSKTYEDVETIQGKLFLKDQIMTSMNGILHRGSVKEVYIGEFIVQ